MTIEILTLRNKLIEARYKILVACRPIAPARTAFNLVLQGLVDAVKASGTDSAAIEAIQKELTLDGIRGEL